MTIPQRPHRAEINELVEESRAGRPLSPTSRTALKRGAARLMFAEATLQEIGLVLGDVGVRWLPIKGADLATRGLFEQPEERPFSDIDILIDSRELDTTQRALTAGGWRALQTGSRQDEYLAEEGYAWQAQSDGELLEVHHRLWGSVPIETASAVLTSAIPDPNLGSTALRPSLPWAFILAAVHCWLSPHRDLIAWRDLEKIARSGDDSFITQVTDLTIQYDLVLPVFASARAANAIWQLPTNQLIAETLRPRMRWAESWLCSDSPNPGLSHGRMTLARLVTGRKTRSGWRSVFRTIWAHPGTVAQETPANWSWTRRRILSLARRIRNCA